MKRLNTTVHVQKDDGTHQVFEAGEGVPSWAASKIANPNVWEDDGEPDEDLEPEGAPAKNGPAATRQVWADYAASKNFAVQEDWKRDDIVAAMEAAGLA